jgi:hypothetical protein
MAEKLPYTHAISEVCYLVGWGDEPGGTPEITQVRGMTQVKTGNGRTIVLLTQDGDIQSAWDPMDYDRQMRARDKLAATLREKGLRPHTQTLITPSMWETK